MIVDGVKTSIPLQQELLKQKAFAEGTYPIHWLQDYIAERNEAKARAEAEAEKAEAEKAEAE